MLAYDIPAGALSCVVQCLQWNDGGIVDIFGVTAANAPIYLQRIDMKNDTVLWNGNIMSGTRIMVAASNLSVFQGGRIELRVRKGTYRHMSLGFYATILPCDTTSYVHSDNIYGDPASLSTREIKENIQTVPSAQCLDMIGQLRATLYERPDLNETRLGLISEEVQEALAPLDIDNVCVPKMATIGEQTKEYLALQYERLVPLLIGSINELRAELDALKSRLPKKKNIGTSSISSK